MDEYLAFVKLIGKSLEGKYIYQFMFTTEPDAVWGENFNVVPSGIIPDLSPDPNSLSSKGKVIIDEPLVTACESTCFSMQDCIDGIISLCFFPIDSENELILPFSMEINEVRKKLKEVGLEIIDFEGVKYEPSQEEIDNLVKDLENEKSEDDEEF